MKAVAALEAVALPTYHPSPSRLSITSLGLGLDQTKNTRSHAPPTTLSPAFPHPPRLPPPPRYEAFKVLQAEVEDIADQILVMYDGKGQPGAGTTLSNGSVVANVRRRHCRRHGGRSSGAVSTLHTLVHRYQRHTHRRYRGCRPSLRCAAPAPAPAPTARAPTARPQQLRRPPLRPLPLPPPRRPRRGARPRHERRASSRHQAPSGQSWREGRRLLLLVPRPSELRAQQIEERRLEPALRPSPRQARRTSDEAVYRGALCHGGCVAVPECGRPRRRLRAPSECAFARMCHACCFNIK